jgi:hypothetical protein
MAGKRSRRWSRNSEIALFQTSEVPSPVRSTINHLMLDDNTVIAGPRGPSSQARRYHHTEVIGMDTP